MVDRHGLRLIGWVYGGVVAVVAIIAFLLVTSNVNMTVEARPDTAMLSPR